MKYHLVGKLLFGVLLLLLTIAAVFPAAASVLTPIHSTVITGDPNGGTINGQSGTSWITYDEGACAIKCRFDTHLSSTAYSSTGGIPFPFIAGLNVQVEGSGGYTVCFDAKGVKSPQIWAFVDGQWVQLNGYFQGGMVCVRGNGSMMFGFFGKELPPGPAPKRYEYDYEEYY